MLFYQPKEGYCYNSDSVFLYAFAKTFIKKGTVLDVGAGCGILGILLAAVKPITLHMVEVQEKIAKLASENLRVNRIEATLTHADFLTHTFSEKFDTVISNPPFYHEETLKGGNEALATARHSSSMPFNPLLKSINKVIKPEGEFIFCYESRQLGEVLCALKEHKFGVETIRFIHPKAHKRSTIFLCRARKGKNPQLNIEAPFVVFDEQGYTAEAQAIYKELNSHTIKCDP